MRFAKAVLILVCASQAVSAEGPADSVRKAYARSCEAASLFYIDGMLAARSKDFKAYGAHGEPIDLTMERMRYQSLFARALSATKTWEASNFKQVSPTRATCLAHETLTLNVEEAGTEEPSVWVLDSRTNDEWVRAGNEWLLNKSALVSQSFRRVGATP